MCCSASAWSSYLDNLRVIATNEVFFHNAEWFRTPGLPAPAVWSEASEKAGLSRADVLIAIEANNAEALREALPRKRVSDLTTR